MRQKQIRRQKMRLHTKIFLACSILLIVALIVACTFSCIPVMNVIRTSYIRTSQRDLALLTNTTESTLSNLFNYAVSITTDYSVIKSVKQYPNGPQNDIETSLLKSSLGQDVRSIVSINSNIYMYDIFSLSGNAFNIGGYSFLNKLNNQLESTFFQDAAASLAAQMHGPFQVFEKPSCDPVYVYLITKSIVDLDTHEPYGVLVLAVRENRFSKVFNSAFPDSETCCYIVDEDLNIVSCTNQSLLNQNLQKVAGLTDQAKASLLSDGQCSASYNGNEALYMISSPVSTRVDWHILAISPMTLFYSAWMQVFKTIIGVSLCACLFLLLISYTLSYEISRPIRSLVDSIRTTMEGNFLRSIPDPNGNYEIDILYQSYIELLDHINALIDHINREQEEKSNYKFQLIQAQIKPHFLYNTLMTIKSLIDLDMNETASECIYAMSSFYRLSLNKGNDILKMGDEIELSMQYMYIQKLRYIDKLDYIFDVPQSLYPYYIPKMTIQPILENAIYHGVKEKADKGIIEVTGRDMGDRMEITVMDNGCGMTSQTLAQLRASINSKDADIQPHNESFGLYSVNRRIRMLYGESYGLYIDSRLGEYTTVTLMLPKNTSVGGIS